jgi:hypothetical protein
MTPILFLSAFFVLGCFFAADRVAFINVYGG